MKRLWRKRKTISTGLVVEKPLPKLPAPFHINNLPYELLVHIFLQGLPDSNAVLDFRRFPLLSTAVCRRWRQTAISSPQLWSSLHLEAPKYDCEDYHTRSFNLAKLAEIHLSRSGDLPLSVSLVASPIGGRVTGAQILLETLLLFARRWEQVSFDMPADAYSPLFSLGPGAEDLPRLKTMHLYTDRLVEADRLPPHLLVEILSTPALRRLSLQNIKIPIPSISQLTEIHVGFEFASSQRPIEWLSLTEALMIVKEAACVTDCSLCIKDISFPKIAERTIVGRKLESLSLFVHVESFSTALQEYFKRMHLPVLRRLSMRTCFRTRGERLPMTLPFIDHPDFTSLELLEITQFPMQQDHSFTDYVLSLSNLRHLCLVEFDGFPIVSREMIHRLSIEPFDLALPHLEQFILSNHDGGNLEDFCQLVRSRRAQSSALRSVLVNLRSETAYEDVDYWVLHRLYRETGMVAEHWHRDGSNFCAYVP